jgi:hypothetical protein
MKNESKNSEATFSKRLVQRGAYVAEIQSEGNLYRFVIRDQNKTQPSIHGAKKSMKETEKEVDTVLNQLCLIDRAA